MTASNPSHQSVVLQRLMQQADLSSYRTLAERAGVSRWQIQQLRQGKIDQMRLATLQQVAVALNLSLVKLLEEFGAADTAADAASTPSLATDTSAAQQVVALQKEYDRLQAKLEGTDATARQTLQREALDTLESWLVQWPTIAHRAMVNESLTAAKVVKFVDPVMRLMESWGVSAISPVGSTVPYDPQRHQLKQGSAQAGERVEVISPGYTYQDKLLHRVLVKRC